MYIYVCMYKRIMTHGYIFVLVMVVCMYIRFLLRV
jgi:hypothetical protein